MAEFQLPEFTINATSAKEDILKLLKIIRPHWEEQDVEIKPITGGYLGLLYKVSSKSVLGDSLTIKIRNIMSQKSLPGVDREFERKVIQVVSKLGLFPKVYAIFQNGYCYQYMEGSQIYNIIPDNTDEKRVFDYVNFPLQLIAKQLAAIHSVKLEHVDFSKTEFLANSLDTLDNHYPPNPFLIDKVDLRKELIELIELSKNFNFNIVLCHGDSHFGNIVWNKEKDELKYVDWEMAKIGFQAYDITGFLVSITDPVFLEAIQFLSDEGNVLEEVRKKFIRLYLTEYSKLNNFELTEEYITEFERQEKFCRLIWHVVVSIYMGALLPEATKNPKWENIETFGVKAFHQYLLVKNKILQDLKLQ